jgi:hypothetical protein
MAASAEGADVTSVNPHEGPEAVVLDLVNPSVALRRLG